MSEIALRTEGLGKKFIIGHKKTGDLREAFAERVKGLFSNTREEKEEFWALQNINFEVTKGEAVGIIGRNGAGKSTLLKILSRITDPSAGRFEINGRVSSLLEVGTGFHAELTGRENIFLNGTILGMRRAEIRKKFDEIVDFSGVEKFLDTPVKHYSSGMKVRLAFSVAAHLEPEILIVDEVLAVGDAEFQKKCLGKMDEVSKNEGRTIIFVSHNLAAVQNLCQKCILLRNGQVQKIGEPSDIISEYLSDPGQRDEKFFAGAVKPSQPVVLTDFTCFANQLESTSSSGFFQIPFYANVTFELSFSVTEQFARDLYIAITVVDTNRTTVATLDNLYLSQPVRPFPGGITRVACSVDKFPLNPGTYFCNIWMSDGYETIQKIEDAFKFEIILSNGLNTGKGQSAAKHGFVYMNQQWITR
ncbi:MAG TPA: polysaccharide ABC transporter ATP-binding protein [Chryseosolibacter sp.]|nr:polysaccharide ABC transporter ATP-binding protein [Chryseosolibacter sp.]